MSTIRAHRLQQYTNPRQRGWDPYDNAHPLLRWYFYRRLDVALRLAEVQPHHRVLDLGCWMGHLMVSLAERAAVAIGVDRADEICREPFFEARVAGWNCLQIAHEMIASELPQARAASLLLRGDLLTLPVESASIDIVFCLDTLEHIADPASALAEIWRSLRPGGLLIFAAPIEFGLALVARQIAGVLTGFFREPYSLVQMVQTLATNRSPAEKARGGMHHAGYDWRTDLDLLHAKFAIERLTFVPLPLLGSMNPTVMIRARKEAR